MDKAKFDLAVSKFEAAGINNYGAFCRGGNYQLRHNGVDSFIVPTADFVVHLKDTDAYENFAKQSQYEVDMVPYENIDYVYPIEVNRKETKDLLSALGISDPDIDKFFKHSPAKYQPNTYSRKMAEGDILDKDGNPVAEMPVGRPAYIKEAAGDRIIQQAIEKDKAKGGV